MIPGLHRAVSLQASSLLDSYGGIEYYVDDFLHLFDDINGRGAVWALLPERGSRNADFKPAYRWSAVPMAASGLRAKLDNRFSPSLFSAARRVVREFRPTVLLCGHVALGPITFAVSRLTGIPYVTIVYGIESWGDLYPQDEWCLRRADRIFSISHWTKRVLVDRGYPADRISVVQPHLPKSYEGLLSPLKERPAGGELVLLTVSRLDAREQYKGHDHVIDALHRIHLSEPDLRLRYVIQGEGTDRARLEAMVRKRGLESIVEFRGKVSDRHELEAAYREADVFIMPSRFGRWDGRWRGEGFGIVYLEAAAFGLGSIAYDCGGATDIIRHGKNGWLVEPDNIAELARLIARLARSRSEVVEMGARARETVQSEFTRGPVRKQLAAALAALPPPKRAK